MKKTIQLHNRTVEYLLKRSNRAKRLRLAVYLDGNFVVTVPKELSQDKAEKHIIQKSQWVLSKIDFFNQLNTKKVLNNNPLNFEKHKDKALEIAHERITVYNKIYNFRYNKINIKNQKTRWGSCSKKKNLNFNYKIAFLPEEIVNYIIVHELCHLKEFNHSPKFWNLIGKAMPEYKNSKNELKFKGLDLY